MNDSPKNPDRPTTSGHEAVASSSDASACSPEQESPRPGRTTLASLRPGRSCAAARADGSDYKALVCVFLYGGMDDHDVVITFVPNDDDGATARLRRRLLTAMASPMGDPTSSPSTQLGGFSGPLGVASALPAELSRPPPAVPVGSGDAAVRRTSEHCSEPTTKQG